MGSFSTRLIAGPGLSLICFVAMAQNVDRLSQVADTLARDSQFSGTVLVAKGGASSCHEVTVTPLSFSRFGAASARCENSGVLQMGKLLS